MLLWCTASTAPPQRTQARALKPKQPETVKNSLEQNERFRQTPCALAQCSHVYAIPLPSSAIRPLSNRHPRQISHIPRESSDPEPETETKVLSIGTFYAPNAESPSVPSKISSFSSSTSFLSLTTPFPFAYPAMPPGRVAMRWPPGLSKAGMPLVSTSEPES